MSAEIVTVAVPPRRVDMAGTNGRADLSTLGGRMSFARLRSKLTQAEVAQKLEKSRATVVQYEQNNILPPLNVVEEMAELLGVTPSFLAYGEASVPGLHRSSMEMVTFGERRVAKDGNAVVSAYAFSRELTDDLGVAPENIEAFVLSHDAPAFELRAGDRLFIDKSITSPVHDRDTYLLKTGNGVEVVRVEPMLTAKKGGEIQMSGPKGQSWSVKESELEFVGAIVATLRKQ